MSGTFDKRHQRIENKWWKVGRARNEGRHGQVSTANTHHRNSPKIKRDYAIAQPLLYYAKYIYIIYLQLVQSLSPG